MGHISATRVMGQKVHNGVLCVLPSGMTNPKGPSAVSIMTVVSLERLRARSLHNISAVQVRLLVASVRPT